MLGVYCLLTTGIATQSLAEQLCPVLNEDRKAEVVVVMTLITALALTAVIFRIISRRLGGVKFWWDDYLVFFAMVRDSGKQAICHIVFIYGVIVRHLG